MWDEEEEETRMYKVLVNHEEQYSLWIADKEVIPPGWRETGKVGTKEECKAYVDEVWTDMRPLSVRKKMEEDAAAAAAQAGGGEADGQQ